MDAALHIFLLELAALFPVVNPPGSALVFLGMTRSASTRSAVSSLGALRATRSSFLSSPYRSAR
jgi:hypothetical protein